MFFKKFQNWGTKTYNLTNNLNGMGNHIQRLSSKKGFKLTKREQESKSLMLRIDQSVCKL